MAHRNSGFALVWQYSQFELLNLEAFESFWIRKLLVNSVYAGWENCKLYTL